MPDSVPETRIREIVREEIEWALKLRRQAVEQAPIIKRTRRAGAGPKPNIARYRDLADRYEAGATMLEIATATGAAVATVRKALDAMGVQVRSQHHMIAKARPDPRLPEMRALWEAGKNMSEIGSQFCLTRERIRQLFNKAGIDTTDRHLSPEEREAVARYVAGDSLNTAAFSIGISSTTLRGLILRAGEKVRPAPKKQRTEKTLADAETAARLYREGKNTRDIAAALGRSKPEMIYRLLSIAGVRPDRRLPAARKHAA